MPRVFYISLGAAAGVLAVRRLTRAAQSLSPQSLAGSFVQSVEDFAADVREAMAEREDELRDALGLNDRPLPDAAGPGSARPF
jgi:hypothetical protein